MSKRECSIFKINKTFAIFPRLIDNKLIWLSHYFVLKQKYEEKISDFHGSFSHYYWSVILRSKNKDNFIPHTRCHRCKGSGKEMYETYSDGRKKPYCVHCGGSGFETIIK